MRPSVLFLSAERPYPLHGGGAYRTASLLHYFAQFADVDLILLSETASPSPVPEGLLRSQQVITLPVHKKRALERYARNARRALQGVPPLIDRLAGLDAQIAEAIGTRHYDLGIVEHFWCAPYIHLLRRYCGDTALDLHNVESVLHRSFAKVDQPLVALGQLRFAAASERMEKALLPQYGRVLVTSAEDERRVKRIAPETRTLIYQNALPWTEIPVSETKPHIVFVGNFEYHPNIDAARFLIREIWPLVRARHPEFQLRLVGRGDAFVRHLGQGEHDVHFTGPLPSTLPEVSEATLAVAPLRAGSGTRIKILEAWAAQRAVVATSLAAEGLEAEVGNNLLLADNSAVFADAICRCIEDASLRTRIAQSGRRTFEEKYSWQKAWENLIIYNVLATAHPPAGYTGTI